MVKAKKLSIDWTLMAKEDLRNVLSFYKKQSPTGYKLVKTEILNTIELISKSALIFEIDKLKKPHDLSIRSFTVYHTRVSYQVTENKITILRLRHTSREPLDF